MIDFSRKRFPDYYLFTFTDILCGIGGIKSGFNQAGACCVYSCEKDSYCHLTYRTLYGDKPEGRDITTLDISKIVDHDILTSGFPCQPFSRAGVSVKKSLGRGHGFNDPTQGTIFFNVKEIIRQKRPAAIFLENVKNLIHHDEGRTFNIILNSLESIGYDISYRVINSNQWIPQSRERLYMVGFQRELNVDMENFEEEFSELSGERMYELEDILEDNVDDKYTLTDNMWKMLRAHREKHERKGNSFGYSLIKPPFRFQNTRTLTARYYKDGSEILIYQGENKNPRKLTPDECFKLMGFPEDLQEKFKRRFVSDRQAYKQIGNSVPVPVVRDIAKLIIKELRRH